MAVLLFLHHCRNRQGGIYRLRKVVLLAYPMGALTNAEQLSKSGLRMFGLEPGKSFCTAFVKAQASAIRKSVAENLVKSLPFPRLGLRLKIYRGGMNKDSEALIFLVLFLSRKKELELVPLKRDGKPFEMGIFNREEHLNR